MSEDRFASKTALMVAAYRARASRAADPLCNDPWAESLAGAEGNALSERYDAVFPHMVLWMGIRTRFLDDCVRHYLDRGFTQVVILGAGLDTRAERLGRDGARFFEVDHPESLADKQARLRALKEYPLDAAVYVSCDFEHQDFLNQLVSAGFDPNSPAVFVWEGVVYYLSREAVEATSRCVAAGCHPQSVLLFDYVGTNMARGVNISERDHALREILTDLGEPVRFGINNLVPLVAACGFTHLRTISFDEACLSLTGTYARERKFRFQSIALVSRTPGSTPWS
jgi:methyltransferase (TIGR00027 family)